MIIAELPPDEELRQLDLASYAILDTQPEDDFNDLVELASQICNTPISLITLLDNDRQWFKAKTGLSQSSTEKHVSFCSHAILQDDIMQVEDATKDNRFFDNPLVTGELNIRFYAGAPIVSPHGHKLGTICIIDTKPKKLTSKEENLLRMLSAQVTKLLELRVRNKLIRERAEEIINLKSKTINRVIQSVEEDKKMIAGNLHEDLAQAVACCILYLDMAQQNEEKRLHFITETKEQLHHVLIKMRDLSNSIMPSPLSWVAAGDIIQDFTDKIKTVFPFRILLYNASTKTEADKINALIAVRIIEKWLILLSERKGITTVTISVQCETQFELCIEDDGPQLGFEALKKEVLHNLIYDRVQALNGNIDLSVSPAGKNILKIVLPH